MLRPIRLILYNKIDIFITQLQKDNIIFNLGKEEYIVNRHITMSISRLVNLI